MRQIAVFILGVVVAYCLLLGAFAIANFSRPSALKWYLGGAAITAIGIAIVVVINLVRSESALRT